MDAFSETDGWDLVTEVESFVPPGTPVTVLHDAARSAEALEVVTQLPVASEGPTQATGRPATEPVDPLDQIAAAVSANHPRWFGLALGVKVPAWAENWSEVESLARQCWERHYPGTWPAVCEQVRQAWLEAGRGRRPSPRSTDG